MYCMCFFTLRPLRDWIDRQHSKQKTPPIGKHGHPASPRSGSARRRSGASASSQRSSSASKVGGRSASLAATGGGGGAGGGGGGSGRQLAPAVQHLFEMSQSPLLYTGSGGLPSRGRTEPGTQLKHLQPTASSKKDGGKGSIDSSSPSQSLLHLLRQGSSPGQQPARLPAVPQSPAVEVHNLLAATIPNYQAPVRPTSHEHSAQGISNCSFNCLKRLSFSFLMSLCSLFQIHSSS